MSTDILQLFLHVSFVNPMAQKQKAFDISYKLKKATEVAETHSEEAVVIPV